MDNMQKIISAIITQGGKPMLAKIHITVGPCKTCTRFPNPDTAARNLIIQKYNLVIDILAAQNSITVSRPDFYTYFRAHQDQFIDNVHPNGLSYQGMAQLWSNALTGR